MNVFFNFRQLAPSVPPLAVLIISYPLGKFLAFILPITTYRLPRWLGGMDHHTHYVLHQCASLSPFISL